MRRRRWSFTRRRLGRRCIGRSVGTSTWWRGWRLVGRDFFWRRSRRSLGRGGRLAAGFTTVRIELFVDDPAAVHAKAVAAGAKQHSEVKEHKYPVVGPKPIGRMLQGAVVGSVGAYLVDWEIFGLSVSLMSNWSTAEKRRSERCTRTSVCVGDRCCDRALAAKTRQDATLRREGACLFQGAMDNLRQLRAKFFNERF